MISLQVTPKLIANVLLPFMNIVVMKALARNKFEGLASLLGLPPSMGIPDSWRSSEPGLLHTNGNSASIEEFAFLQKILRKDDLNAFKDDASILSQSYHSVSSAYDNRSILTFSALGLANMDLSPGDPMIAAVPMGQLELLFRERDPDREFGRLRRVTSAGQSESLGIWTNVETIKQLKSMVEVAELEDQLRDLKINLDQTQTSATQYANLLNKRKMMKRNMLDNPLCPVRESFMSFDNSFDEPSVVPSVVSHGNTSQVSKELSQVSKELSLVSKEISLVSKASSHVSKASSHASKANSHVSKEISYHSYRSEDDKYSRASRIEEEPQDEREPDPNQCPVQKLEISTHKMHDIPQRRNSAPHRTTDTTQRMTTDTNHNHSDPHLKAGADGAGAGAGAEAGAGAGTNKKNEEV